MFQFPLHPKNPDRICWGCEKLCPADDLCCGNGTIRSPHPVELFGDDWFEWLNEHEKQELEKPEPDGTFSAPIASQPALAPE